MRNCYNDESNFFTAVLNRTLHPCYLVPVRVRYQVHVQVPVPYQDIPVRYQVPYMYQ